MDSVDGGGDNRGEQGGEKRDIRRPMNAFLIFCKRHRSMVREKHPDRDNRSVTRILGDLWANLAEDEKLVYTNLAKQYKDAFMKAHPDYKWHSSEKVSQPVKMATRPTNARPPRSLSTSDYPSEGAIMPGQLAEGGCSKRVLLFSDSKFATPVNCDRQKKMPNPDKMGGLNLLLMAGQHSFPIRDKPVTSASIMERRMTAPDVSGANAALLQLAEMCSSELCSTQADDTALCSAPPKKRARHWSYSEFGHASSTDWANKNAAFVWNLPPLPTPSVPCQPTQMQTASQVSATHTSHAESTFQIQGGEEEKKQQPTNNNAALSLPVGSSTSYIMPANSSAPYTMPANSSAPYTTPTNSSTPFNMPANSSPLYTVPANNVTPYTLPAQSDFSQQNQHDFTPVANTFAQKACPKDAQTSAAVSSELGIPPKKKFTKLQEACKSELPGAPSPNSAAGGCLSDQNDNAIFTCGKLVVDHIIDRLFSASFTPDQNISARNLSADDIERARKILTADISEREKLQGSASRNMGRLLSEVVHKPQNLVEKVIEEAYSSIDLKQMKQMETLMPQAKHHSPLDSKAHHVKPAMQAEAVASHLKPSSQLETISSLMKQEAVETEVNPLVHVTTSTVHSTSGCMYKGVKPVVCEQAHIKEQPTTRPQLKHCKYDVKGATLKNAPDEKLLAPTSTENTDFLKEESRESTQDEDENFMQPVRKSQRRNRGQRYQELINEGIIQPSKERLAARRHEQTAPYFHSYHDGEDCGLEENGERLRHMLKRSISESDSISGDEKRYRTADFDLEAEIATLPPCSLEQVTRRRPSRKRSDSESSRKQGCPSSPTTEDSVAPTMKTHQSEPSTKPEPLTGSQKRKARKHSISRLVASTDAQSGGALKSPGIVTTVPLVRDATVKSSAVNSTSKTDVKPDAFTFSSAASLTSSETTPPLRTLSSAAATTTLPSPTMTITSVTTAMTTTGIAAAVMTSVMAAAITDVVMAAASSTTTMVTSVSPSFMASQASLGQNLISVSSVSQNSAAGSDRNLLWPETSSVILGAAQKMQLLAEEQRKSEGKGTAKNDWNRSTGAKSKDSHSALGVPGFRTAEVSRVAPVPTEFTNLKELDDNTWIPCFIPKGKPDAGSALYAKSSEHQAAVSTGSTKNQRSNCTEARKHVEKHRDVSSLSSSFKDCRKRSSGGNGGKGVNSLSDARVLAPAADSKSGGNAKSNKQMSGARKKTAEGKRLVTEECGLVALTEKDHTNPTPLVSQSATSNACQNDSQKVQQEKQTVSFSAVRVISLPGAEQKPSSEVKIHLAGSDIPKSDSTVSVSSPVTMYESGRTGHQDQSRGQLACVLSALSCAENTCKFTTADCCTYGPQDRKPIATCDAINIGSCLKNAQDLTDNQESSVSSNNSDEITADCASSVAGNSTSIFFSGASENVPVEKSNALHKAPDTRPCVVTPTNLSAADTFQNNTNETIITAVTSLASVVPSSSCYGSTSLHFSGLSTVSTATLVSCVESSVSMTTTVGAPMALEMMHDDSDDMETTVGSQMLCRSPLPGSPSVGVVHS